MTHATWFSPHDVSMTGCRHFLVLVVFLNVKMLIFLHATVRFSQESVLRPPLVNEMLFVMNAGKPIRIEGRVAGYALPVLLKKQPTKPCTDTLPRHLIRHL